jgi:hypothetical protein
MQDLKARSEGIDYYERQGIARYWIHLGSQHRHSELPRHLRARCAAGVRCSRGGSASAGLPARVHGASLGVHAKARL